MPSEFLVLSHVAQDTTRSWFRGYLTQSVHIPGHFWPFLGRFSDMLWSYNNKGLFVTRKSRNAWSSWTVFLHLAVLIGFRGHLGPKEVVLGHKMRSFGAPPDLAPPPLGASSEFLAQIWQGHHLGSRMARVEWSPKRWQKGEVLLACCLLACLLLARFKGRGV